MLPIIQMFALNMGINRENCSEIGHKKQKNFPSFQKLKVPHLLTIHEILYSHLTETLR